ILVQMKGDRLRGFSSIKFQSELKEGNQAQAVNPIQQISWLMTNIVGNVRTMLIVLTSLIIVVSGVGIFVSIYNSMSDRKREIAIMRALGAGRATVFAIILSESVLLCLGGGILGMLLGHGLVFIAAPIIEARSGLLIDPFAFSSTELILLPILVVLASLVGFIPAMTAYRTDVASTLSD
ncbi:MAG: FtsX-like permease family protein, partial [Planctomycetaceae bacterium]|nr:FtsX-like permease family protein [Planctomycetaceae bacterium]